MMGLYICKKVLVRGRMHYVSDIFCLFVPLKLWVKKLSYVYIEVGETQKYEICLPMFNKIKLFLSKSSHEQNGSNQLRFGDNLVKNPHLPST